MKTARVYVPPLVPVAKLYKPKLEITNVYVDNEDGVWYLFLVTKNDNNDECTYKYRLDFYEN